MVVSRPVIFQIKAKKTKKIIKKILLLCVLLSEFLLSILKALQRICI